MQTVKFNRVGFNPYEVTKMTQDEFVNTYRNTFYRDRKPADRVTMLKRAYALCKEAMDKGATS